MLKQQNPEDSELIAKIVDLEIGAPVGALSAGDMGCSTDEQRIARRGRRGFRLGEIAIVIARRLVCNPLATRPETEEALCSTTTTRDHENLHNREEYAGNPGDSQLFHK